MSIHFGNIRYTIPDYTETYDIISRHLCDWYAGMGHLIEEQIQPMETTKESIVQDIRALRTNREDLASYKVKNETYKEQIVYFKTIQEQMNILKEHLEKGVRVLNIPRFTEEEQSRIALLNPRIASRLVELQTLSQEEYKKIQNCFETFVKQETIFTERMTACEQSYADLQLTLNPPPGGGIMNRVSTWIWTSPIQANP